MTKAIQKGSLNHNYKHGGKGTRLYNIWKSIKRRCTNKNDIGYKHYGERGIKRCQEWNDFAQFKEWAFKNGYSDNLTIDRMDYNGDYSPNNCRWIDMIVQNNNTRKNVFIEYNNERLTLTQAQRKYGIKAINIANRLRAGWDIEKALTIKAKLGNNGSNI